MIINVYKLVYEIQMTLKLYIMNTQNKPQHITLEDIKDCPEFAHLNDEQAQFVLDTIIAFCEILASQHKNLTGYSDEQDNDIFKEAA